MRVPTLDGFPASPSPLALLLLSRPHFLLFSVHNTSIMVERDLLVYSKGIANEMPGHGSKLSLGTPIDAGDNITHSFLMFSRRTVDPRTARVCQLHSCAGVMRVTGLIYDYQDISLGTS